MNYRNKSIFDWYDYKPNDISSTTSLVLMNYLKDNIKRICHSREFLNEFYGLSSPRPMTKADKNTPAGICKMNYNKN